MKIGITGGIASGKSLVSAKIKDLKLNLIDCDIISHEAFESELVQSKLKEAFDINTNHVERQMISKIVFNDQNKLNQLNEIIYPVILDTLNKELEKYKDKIVFVDCPLLYDNKMEDMFDKIIFVYVDTITQVNRLMERDNIDSDYALQKIRKQLSMEEKYYRAISNNDYVIENTFTKENTLKQLEYILKDLGVII